MREAKMMKHNNIGRSSTTNIMANDSIYIVPSARRETNTTCSRMVRIETPRRIRTTNNKNGLITTSTRRMSLFATLLLISVALMVTTTNPQNSSKHSFFFVSCENEEQQTQQQKEEQTSSSTTTMVEEIEEVIDLDESAAEKPNEATSETASSNDVTNDDETKEETSASSSSSSTETESKTQEEAKDDEKVNDAPTTTQEEQEPSKEEEATTTTEATENSSVDDGTEEEKTASTTTSTTTEENETTATVDDAKTTQEEEDTVTDATTQEKEETNEESSTTTETSSSDTVVQSGPLVDMLGETLLTLKMVDETHAQLHAHYTNEALKGKSVIGIYFSADWCGPCRKFTPDLVKFYQLINNKKGIYRDKFAIVWVSRCRSMETFGQYFSHMDREWYAMQPELAMGEHGQALSQKFGVKGIPTLVLIDEVGSVITTDARNKIPVDKMGIGFPWRNPLVTAYLNLVPKSLRVLLKYQVGSLVQRVKQLLRLPQAATTKR